MAYRFYVTDELYVLNNNLVQFVGGSKIDARLYDIMHLDNTPEDTRTSQDIIEGLKEKMRRLK